jgi:hypothetical protein
MRRLTIAVGAAILAFAPAANADTISFNYVGHLGYGSGFPTDGLVASGTLDVIGLAPHTSGTVISGTGTITAPFLDSGATETLTLLTFSTPGVSPAGVGFSYPFGGGSLTGDTRYPLDTYGLLFFVSGLGNTGFNLSGSENGGDADQGAVQGSNNFHSDVGNSTFTFVTATPLPPTWLMMLSGLVGLGFFVYRGTKEGPAAIIAA